MMSSRKLVFVALLVTLAAVAVSATTLTVGTRAAGDRQLWGQIVKKSPVSGKIVEEDQTIDVGNFNTITQVVARDQENKGATAKITSGGPTNSKVSLHFTSPNGGAINYIVDVYGKERY